LIDSIPPVISQNPDRDKSADKNQSILLINNLGNPASDDDMTIVQSWWDGQVSLEHVTCKTNIPEREIKRASLPCVAIILHESNTQYKALFDSGACVSAIDSTLVKELGCHEDPCNGNMHVANGKTFSINSKVRLKCSVGDQTGWISFIVVDNLSHDLILGNDFITVWKVISSIHDGTYHFYGSNREFKFLYKGIKDSCNTLKCQFHASEMLSIDTYSIGNTADDKSNSTHKCFTVH